MKIPEAIAYYIFAAIYALLAFWIASVGSDLIKSADSGSHAAAMLIVCALIVWSCLLTGWLYWYKGQVTRRAA